MAIERLSDDDLRETIKTYEANGRSKNKTAKALGITRFTVRHRLIQAAKRGMLGFDAILPGFVVHKTSEQRGQKGEVQKRWVQQKPAPGEAFEVPPGHTVKGVSALIDPDGRELAKWVKTKEGARDLTDAIKATFEEYKGRSELVPPPTNTSSDLLTVYPVGDFHAGLYAWGAETGEDWDLSIAEKVLLDTMTELVSVAPQSQTGIVLSLGDFFHTDDASNQTPASRHALDVDTRRTKVLQVGVKLMIRCIELALAKHEKVLVRCLPGNHDPATTPGLSIALWAFFHSNPRVEVDCGPSRFFYYQFGKVLVGATHGDQCKMADFPGVMAATKPNLWGGTRFRYGYFGHIHHKSQICKEINGVVCESFQVLPPADAWHAGMGYGAGRSMMAITHHKDHGEKIRNVVSITPSC